MLWRELVVFALLVFAPPSFATGINCARAQSPSEKTICSDIHLLALDAKLSAAFDKALASSDSKDKLRSAQRSWIPSAYAVCLADSACLAQALEHRIEQFNQGFLADEAYLWTGRYIRAVGGKLDNTARFSVLLLMGSKIRMSGEAFRAGSVPGAVNLGQVEGVASVHGNRSKFDFEGCKGELAIYDRRLVVEKEVGCGGLGVSFVGEYLRQ